LRSTKPRLNPPLPNPRTHQWPPGKRKGRPRDKRVPARNIIIDNIQTLPQPTSAEIVTRAKSLLADGYSDHDISAILKIDVQFVRQIFGASRLLAERFGKS
jgi:hypothetical protein